MKNQSSVPLKELIKKDKLRNNIRRRERLWIKEQHEKSIDKLPNEFRHKERDYNHFNDRNQDSYCKLYAEE